MGGGRWCHTHDCPRARSPFFLRSPSPSLYTHLGFHTDLGPFPGWVEVVRASSPGTSRLAKLYASEHLGSGTALRAVPSVRPMGWGDTWLGFPHGRKAGLCGQGEGGREGLMCFELTTRSLGLWRAWLPAWGSVFRWFHVVIPEVRASAGAQGPGPSKRNLIC